MEARAQVQEASAVSPRLDSAARRSDRGPPNAPTRRERESRRVKKGNESPEGAERLGERKSSANTRRGF